MPRVRLNSLAGAEEERITAVSSPPRSLATLYPVDP